MDPEIKQMATQPDFVKYSRKLEAMFSELDVAFLMDFGRTMLMMHTLMVLTESYFQTIGTSKGRFFILVRLLMEDTPQGQSISELRPFYPITYAAMSGVLDTLEKDGMVQRMPNPTDRRKVNIRITNTGRNFMMDFFPKHLEYLKDISTLLTDDDRAILPNILKKLISGFERFLSADTRPVSMKGG
jgi:DNA-binding MarR family transcriptional regulator